MNEFFLRFLIGGIVISTFALCGDVLRPKSFAGLFGAAPSVALASLGLTHRQHGSVYVAIEGKSMVFGALAFLVYAYLVGQILKRTRLDALTSSILMLPVWFTVSFASLWIGTRFS